MAKRKRSKRKNKLRIFLFIGEFIVLAVMIGVLYFLLKADKIEKGTMTDDSEKALKINDELVEQANQSSEAGVEWKMSGVTTIALFGVDARDSSLGKGNRTDTIMLASINEDNGEVRLCSIYRDTYLNIGNDTYNKANAAYAQGGPEQAIQMLNTCFDLDIKDYATVNFTALIDTIDILGGVPIDVHQDEIEYLNSYQICMTGEEDGLNAFGEKAYKATAGVDYTPVTQSGVQNLNGTQATAYCRIRYVGNDFERTNRQRNVLTEVANKAKKADLSTLNNMIDEIFPKIKTSFTAGEMLDYASKASKYSVVDSTGFPFNQVTGKMGKAGSSVVAVDFASDVKDLHTFLYGEDSYTPTARVQEISNRVASDKNKYGL